MNSFIIACLFVSSVSALSFEGRSRSPFDGGVTGVPRRFSGHPLGVHHGHSASLRRFTGIPGQGFGGQFGGASSRSFGGFGGFTGQPFGGQRQFTRRSFGGNQRGFTGQPFGGNQQGTFNQNFEN